jgi:ribosomal protein L40E
MSEIQTPTMKVPETVRIPPSPKILKVLARIEFEPWQCIAELVDNGFDEFLEVRRRDPKSTEPMQVSVTLPSSAALKSGDATIVIADNGRGMTIDGVRESVRAGFSGNDPISKLGLFGMGFNVATARLGAVTRFLTTRVGDSEWIGVEIDVDKIPEGFEVPVIHEPKDSPAEHGTRVEISRLEPLAERLTRPAAQDKLRATLGDVYAYLLAEGGFRLYVNSIAVKPRRHCVWSAERSVTRGRETIPARIEVDEVLADSAVCRLCGTWQEADNTKCERCDSEQLEVRERRVHGWLGVQRYLDPKEFGIDFLRNGRKILRYDKSLFQWRDPDDPRGQGDTEYPIELPANQGRLVGEIHLDHVPVIYTKDSFDTNDRAWRKAVQLLRGEGPLLPQRAKQLNYPFNESPLAKLHRGYRRNDPGKNYLTPGDGKNRLDLQEWAKRFHAGDVEFDDDTKWWEAVVQHEKIKAELKKQKEEREAGDAAALEDPTLEFLGDEADDVAAETVAEPTAEGAKPLTDADRIELYLKGASLLPELNAEFKATGVAGKPIRLTAYRVLKALAPEGKRIPVWLTGQKGGSFIAFVDTSHPHFVNYDDDPEDLVLMQLADFLLERAQGSTTIPITSVFTELKDRYLLSHVIDRGRLVPEANQLMRDIQERMVGCVEENPSRPYENVLSEHERKTTGDRITEGLRTADIDSVVYSGDYLRYVPATSVTRIVEEWPEAFFDGRLFSNPYEEVKSPEARRQMVASVTSYLNDVGWLTTAPSSASREQLIRARLSLKLLPEEIASEDE